LHMTYTTLNENHSPNSKVICGENVSLLAFLLQSSRTKIISPYACNEIALYFP
jgi:hypothetical protein